MILGCLDTSEVAKAAKKKAKVKTMQAGPTATSSDVLVVPSVTYRDML